MMAKRKPLFNVDRTKLSMDKSFKSLVTDYLNTVKVRPKTKEQYSCTYEALYIQLAVAQTYINEDIKEAKLKIKPYDIFSNFASIDKPFAEAVQAYLYQEDKMSTANGKLSALSRLWKHMNNVNDTDLPNPFDKLTLEKEQHSVGYIPTATEVRSILEYGRTNAKELANLKHLVALQLIVDTSSRISETLALKWTDINFAEMEVTFRAETTKSGKQYTKPISDKLTMQYLNMLKAYAVPEDHDQIFTTSNHKVIERNSLSRYLKNIVKKLQLDSSISPHSLRRYRLSSLINDGEDIYFVAKVMASHSTTTLVQTTYSKPDIQKAKVSISKHKLY